MSHIIVYTFSLSCHWMLYLIVQTLSLFFPYPKDLLKTTHDWMLYVLKQSNYQYFYLYSVFKFIMGSQCRARFCLKRNGRYKNFLHFPDYFIKIKLVYFHLSTGGFIIYYSNNISLIVCTRGSFVQIICFY